MSGTTKQGNYERISKDIISHNWKLVSKEYVPREHEVIRISKDLKNSQTILMKIGSKTKTYNECSLFFCSNSFSNDISKIKTWKLLESYILLATKKFKYSVYIDADVINVF